MIQYTTLGLSNRLPLNLLKFDTYQRNLFKRLKSFDEMWENSDPTCADGISYFRPLDIWIADTGADLRKNSYPEQEHRLLKRNEFNWAKYELQNLGAQ